MRSTFQAAGPHLHQGRNEPRMLLRQREGQDNENNAQALGTPASWGVSPTLWKEVPLGPGHELQDTPCLVEPTSIYNRHLTGPISQRRLPRTNGLTGSSWALPTMRTSYDGQLWNHPDLRMNFSSAPYSCGTLGLSFLACKIRVTILISQDYCEESRR